MNIYKKAALAAIPLAGAAILLFGSAAYAAQPFTLTPGVFDPSNSCPGIYSNWDNSTGNPTPSIKLIKPCTTATVAAPFVEIATGMEGNSITNLTELNFDYLNGGHCGAGAPRFNVQVNGTTYFLSCNQGTHSASTTNPNWTHVVFGPTDFAAAGIPTTGTLEDLYIIFDEGSDTPSGGTIGTPGIVNIDNISINGQVVSAPESSPSPSPSPLSKDSCKNGGYKVFQGTNGQPGPFKNQGDCVSYFATGGKNPPSGTKVSPQPS